MCQGKDVSGVIPVEKSRNKIIWVFRGEGKASGTRKGCGGEKDKEGDKDEKGGGGKIWARYPRTERSFNGRREGGCQQGGSRVRIWKGGEESSKRRESARDCPGPNVDQRRAHRLPTIGNGDQSSGDEPRPKPSPLRQGRQSPLRRGALIGPGKNPGTKEFHFSSFSARMGSRGKVSKNNPLL